MFTNHKYLIYMYDPNLTLNKQQWLICHKIKPNLTNPKCLPFFKQPYFFLFVLDFRLCSFRTTNFFRHILYCAFPS